MAATGLVVRQPAREARRVGSEGTHRRGKRLHLALLQLERTESLGGDIGRVERSSHHAGRRVVRRVEEKVPEFVRDDPAYCPPVQPTERLRVLAVAACTSYEVANGRIRH